MKTLKISARQIGKSRTVAYKAGLDAGLTTKEMDKLWKELQ